MILVAGAGGFIGGHLVKRLLADGRDVRAVDLKPEREWWQVHAAAENVPCVDLRKSFGARAMVRGADTVYNLACDMGGMGFIESHKADCMVSVLINTNLLRAAAEFNVSRFFFSSTACVYRHDLQAGPALRLRECDAYPADPEDGYGWEKLFSERMCRHFREDYGLETRVARFHTIYGPHEAWRGGREKVPAAFCRKVAEVALGRAEAVEVWGDGAQERSFLYVDDCVEGVIRLAQSNFADPVNIGSENPMPILDLLKVVEDVAGTGEIPIRFVAGPLGVRGRSSDNTLVRNVIGWEPSVALSEGIARTYEWVFERVRASV